MRLGTLSTPDGPRAVVLDDHGFVEVAAADPALPDSVRLLLRLGPGALDRAREASRSASAPRHPYQPERLLPAIPEPGKLLCIGRNYAEHVQELGNVPAERPEVFVRVSTSLTGPYAPVVRPRASQQMDYEVELAVVIGVQGRHIPSHRALEHVAGYCVLNDVSIRDYQMAAQQWTPGKNFDRTGPLGPFLVTADEVPDPQQLRLSTAVLRRDGKEEVLQDSNTRLMMRPVADLVAFLSSFTTLEPGDVIATGTPGGVGLGRRPPRWLVPGEVLISRVQGVGELRNPVVDEDAEPAG
jgi:2-keto-4-pentenoate hydratase/2-oxohepta-3-ene-1,7-dioic acid hydratase in catechol pathway